MTAAMAAQRDREIVRLAARARRLLTARARRMAELSRATTPADGAFSYMSIEECAVEARRLASAGQGAGGDGGERGGAVAQATPPQGGHVVT